MPSLNINIIPLAFTVATTLGVLLHDTQVDRAAKMAIALPAAFVTYAAVDSVFKSSDHIHVERVGFSGHMAALRIGLPRIQPRDDDRKYIQTKKAYLSTGDAVSIWPSV